MSSKREREKRREERIGQESGAGAEERRRKLLQMAAGAAFLAVAVVLVLIVVNMAGSDGGDTELEGAEEISSQLSGIPQRDLVLGDPKAPVEVVEFGDLQCPFCKGVAEDVLPPVIEGAVEEGDAKLVFRNFTILGSESVDAAAAAVAAGNQGRGWSFVELFYKNQGRENAGYVTDEFLEAVAEAAGVPDLDRWNQDRRSQATEKQIEAENREAQRLGLSGTPSFAIEGPETDGLEVLGTPTDPGQLEQAIQAAT